MDVIDKLMNEHRQIENALLRLEQTAEVLRRREERNKRLRLRRIVAFLSGYAEAIHQHKEEQMLFRRLVELGLSEQSGPIASLRGEHEQGRQLQSALRRISERENELDPNDTSKLVETTTS